MNYRLNVTATARDDITRNAAWWAEHHSLDQALRWYDAIYEQLEMLLSFPESYAFSAENDGFRYELREKLIGVAHRKTYRAIFTIVEMEVRVLAVRRCSQDTFWPDDVP